MFKISDEPEWPNEGGVFKIYNELESSSEEASLRYMVSPYRQMRRRV